MRVILRAAALLALLLPTGCRGPTATIGELGFPMFADVVGPETKFERPDPRQTSGMDAFPERADPEGDHYLAVRYMPLSSDTTIAIEFKARARSRPGLDKLALAVYPATRTEAERFSVSGTLPAGIGAPIAEAVGGDRDETGGLTLAVLFPRAAVPEGTERLIVPSLAQYEDGWIYVRFYQTAVPAPIKLVTPEEMEALRGATPPEAAPADGGAAGEPAAPTAPEAEPAPADEPQ